MHAALPLVYCSRACDEQHTAHVDRIFEKKEGSLSLVLCRSCRPARVASSAERAEQRDAPGVGHLSEVVLRGRAKGRTRGGLERRTVTHLQRATTVLLSD